VLQGGVLPVEFTGRMMDSDRFVSLNLVSLASLSACPAFPSNKKSSMAALCKGGGLFSARSTRQMTHTKTDGGHFHQDPSFVFPFLVWKKSEKFPMLDLNGRPLSIRYAAC